MTESAPAAEQFSSDRPFVFRNATVITMDQQGVLEDADVLVIGRDIAAVGHRLEVPRARSRSTRRGASSPPASSTPIATCGSPRSAATAATGRSASTSSSTT